MFVTAADFINNIKYNLPNLDKVSLTFTNHINDCEYDVLVSLLGKSFYDSFIEGLDEDYPDAKWVNLRDGEDYSMNLKTYVWVGMKELLIPYIYAMWIRENQTAFTGIGVVVKKGENSTVVNPSKRIAKAYNEFSNFAGNKCDTENTLYGYLSDQGLLGVFDNTFDSTFATFRDYLNFEFQEPGLMNAFNI